MRFSGAEDRLNPVAPAHADEATLGGYLAIHGRAAAFEGADGRPYTVAIEAEPAEAGDLPWVGFLLFLRWADNGTTIMGHLESGDLIRAANEAEALQRLEALPLPAVKEILDGTIQRTSSEAPADA